MKIRWCSYIPNSLQNGEGVRDVIFLSGCIHNCDGCHNIEAQDPNYGKDIELEEIIKILKSNNDMVDGITLSGGDPLFQYEKTVELCKAIKNNLENNNIWLYTGYTFKYIQKHFSEILKHVDVIVDGRYEKDLPSAEHRGSNNQQIIILNK